MAGYDSWDYRGPACQGTNHPGTATFVLFHLQGKAYPANTAVNIELGWAKRDSNAGSGPVLTFKPRQLVYVAVDSLWRGVIYLVRAANVDANTDKKIAS